MCHQAATCVLLFAAATCCIAAHSDQHPALKQAQAGSVTLAQQGWSLEIDGLSSIKAKVPLNAVRSSAGRKLRSTAQGQAGPPPANPLVFCGTTREYECPPGTTCCCSRRAAHGAAAAAGTTTSSSSSSSSNGSAVGNPRCDWYCCQGSCCSDRRHYCPTHLPHCDASTSQCTAQPRGSTSQAQAEPLRSMVGGPNSCVSASSRVHSIDTPGASRPGGSNVVKDALSGFATRFITGGTVLHESLTKAEDYGVGGAAVVSNRSSTAGGVASGGSKP